MNSLFNLLRYPLFLAFATGSLLCHGFSLSGSWPRSQKTRWGFAGSYSLYHQNPERFTTYYDSLGYSVGFNYEKDLTPFTDGGLPGIGTSLQNGSGILLRVNLFGYLIGEPDYAVPRQNEGLRNAMGLNLLPGRS